MWKQGFKQLSTVGILGLALILGACGATIGAITVPLRARPIEETSNYETKKVMFVSSYASDYEGANDMDAGLRSVLDGTGVELRVAQMGGSQSHTDEAFWREAAQTTFREIQAFQPDVVIAAGDAAQNYLVIPYMQDTTIPVVIGDANPGVSSYGFPWHSEVDRVTEAAKRIFVADSSATDFELMDELITHLSDYAERDLVSYVTIASEVETMAANAYNEQFFDGKMAVFSASSWEDFKTMFVAAQATSDIIVLGSNAGVDWPREEAADFFRQNTYIPTGTIHSWMAPYALITVAPDATQQGKWAGETALAILDGTPAASMPIAETMHGSLMVNLDIADQLAVVFPSDMLQSAAIYVVSSK